MIPGLIHSLWYKISYTITIYGMWYMVRYLLCMIHGLIYTVSDTWSEIYCLWYMIFDTFTDLHLLFSSEFVPCPAIDTIRNHPVINTIRNICYDIRFWHLTVPCQCWKVAVDTVHGEGGTSTSISYMPPPSTCPKHWGHVGPSLQCIVPLMDAGSPLPVTVDCVCLGEWGATLELSIRKK